MRCTERGTDMIDINEMQRYLRSIGKCGSVSSDGHVCTIRQNHIGQDHKAVILGGIDDGLEIAKWSW